MPKIHLLAIIWEWNRRSDKEQMPFSFQYSRILWSSNLLPFCDATAKEGEISYGIIYLARSNWNLLKTGTTLINFIVWCIPTNPYHAPSNQLLKLIIWAQKDFYIGYDIITALIQLWNQNIWIFVSPLFLKFWVKLRILTTILSYILLRFTICLELLAPVLSMNKAFRKIVFAFSATDHRTWLRNLLRIWPVCVPSGLICCSYDPTGLPCLPTRIW